MVIFSEVLRTASMCGKHSTQKELLILGNAHKKERKKK